MRRYPKLVLINAEVQEKSLILTAPGMDTLKVELITDGEMVDTAIIGEQLKFSIFLILLTLFRAGSRITLWGRAGKILPTSSLGYINPLNDLLVLRIYCQVNILDISSP